MSRGRLIGVCVLSSGVLTSAASKRLDVPTCCTAAEQRLRSRCQFPFSRRYTVVLFFFRHVISVNHLDRRLWVDATSPHTSTLRLEEHKSGNIHKIQQWCLSKTKTLKLHGVKLGISDLSGGNVLYKSHFPDDSGPFFYFLMCDSGFTLTLPPMLHR